MSKKLVNLLAPAFALILGLVAGFIGFTYYKLPNTEELIIGNEVFYSYNNGATVETAENITANDGDVSVHFLELGNKYTGDCTYIKVGENVDILIDCGSRSNSVSAVSSYLNNYVTDGTLEYVVVTHAHRDHYAGFATGTKVDSIFDLYVCENIIDFGTQTNQSGNTYNNYIRERTAEIEAGANYYTAIDCWNNANGASRQFVLDQINNITFNILYNKYYEIDDANENNYSVCTLLSQGDKHFLFTGDLDDETTLVESNELPQVEVYKAGHHGSGTSSSAALLVEIDPNIVCVCCCAGSPEYTKDNAKQFPTQEFIDRVSIHTKAIYVTTLSVPDGSSYTYTSMNGNIVVMSTLTTIGVNCSNNNTILKDTEWFKANRTWLAPGAVQ